MAWAHQGECLAREGVPLAGGETSESGQAAHNIYSQFLQDMHRFVSPMIKIAFDGPDVPEQSLYDLLRVGFDFTGDHEAHECGSSPSAILRI